MGGREKETERVLCLDLALALQWVRSGSDLVSFTFVYFLHDFSYYYFFL